MAETIIVVKVVGKMSVSCQNGCRENRVKSLILQTLFLFDNEGNGKTGKKKIKKIGEYIKSYDTSVVSLGETKR